MAQQSRASADLWLLDSADDFLHYTHSIVAEARRSLAILTHHLDPTIYADAKLISALSTFARSSRHTEIQILIKDTKLAAQTNHLLVRLAQRLSSKIHLRKLTVQPADKDMAFVIGDTDKLLFKNDDTVYRGFFNSDAAVEIKRLREEFGYLWQYAEPEPEFQVIQL